MSTSGTSTKTKRASRKLIDSFELLLQEASNAPSYTLEEQATEAKLYEMAVLVSVLEQFSGPVIAQGPKEKNVFRLAGGPSKATKNKFTFFQLMEKDAVAHEVWLSVEVTTRSFSISSSTDAPLSSRHEIDVGVFSALPKNSYPSYLCLHAGFSCKHMDASKVHIRELLGLRLETAACHAPQPSLVTWLHPNDVPGHPASPLYLASSDLSVGKYAEPIDVLGAYTRHIPFPSTP